MTIPTPQTIQIPTPQYRAPQLDPLPNLLNIDYITNTFNINIHPLQYNPILDTFYTALLFSVIEDKLDQFYSEIISALDFVYSEFVFEKKKLIKKHSMELAYTSNLFGIASKNTLSGVYTRVINDLHISEMFESVDLVIKYREKITKALQQAITSFLSTIDKTNSLYKDIYEKDFKITAEAYKQWLEYSINAHNKYLAEAKLELEKRRVNLDIFSNKLLSLRAQLEEFKNRVENQSLSNELTEAINKFYLLNHNYLTELERYKYLQYEQLKYLNQKYSTELKRYATEIEKINAIAKLVTENINVFNAKFEVEKTKLDIENIKAEVKSKEINIEKIRLSAFDEKLEALYRQYSALYTIDKTRLITAEAQLSNYESTLLSQIKSINQKEYERLISYINNRQKTISALESELSARNISTLNEAIAKIDIDRVTDRARTLSAGYNQSNSIIAHATADWYRTCAITSAQVTASFIRSYR